MRKVLALVLGLSVAAVVAQETPKKPTEIRKVGVKPTSLSGKEMFDSYCTACHGRDGKGHGPAASALKGQVPDLTRISERNGGKFPDLHILHVLTQETEYPVHGSKDMPLWGTIFRSLERGNEGGAKLRSYAMLKHLESIQAK